MRQHEPVPTAPQPTAPQPTAPQPTPPTPVDPADLAAVAGAAADRAGGLDPALLADFLPTAAAAVAAGTRIRRRDLDRFAEQGRRAAAAGVALRALVDLYLSAAWQLWSLLPEVAAPAGDPDRPVRAGEVMLRAAADVTAVLAEGYQLARRELLRAQEADRRSFVDELLTGGAYAAGSLLERAARFGLGLAGPHAVLLVEADRQFTETSPLVGVLERSILGARADADALVATRDGRLVVVFAAPDRAAVAGVVGQLSDWLPVDPPAAGGATGPSGIGGGRRGVELRRRIDVGDWHLGIGRPHPGPAGVRASFAEAVEALALGRRAAGEYPGRRIHDAADLLLHRVLIRDEAAMVELVDSVLGPLAAARGGAGPLVDTLAALSAAGGNASAAARALHLSVRALSYRLTRIEELTGLNPGDPAAAYTLATAVTGARLLGWQPG